MFALPAITKSKNKSKEAKTDIINLQKDFNTMIIDEKTKKRQKRFIEPDKIPAESFAKKYFGKWIHTLGRDLKGNLWAIGLPAALVENQAPIDLYIAKHCAEEVAETYGFSSSTWHKIKVGFFVTLIIAIVVVTFFVVTAASGGSIQ
jgi:hypothetical protein